MSEILLSANTLQDCSFNNQIVEEQDRSHNQLLIALCLSILFMSIEAVGGYICGSLAIMTDAAHLLSGAIQHS